jgi:glycosyltransferase involved in cell wall biosynthesis
MSTPESDIELSVVMPCLNEAETIAQCIGKAQEAFRRNRIAGEIIVADNGSTDGSVEKAQALGARVIHVAVRGYGSALMSGIEAARAKYVLMGDADDSYDFLELPVFLERLREGYDLVQGCRRPAGGGTILPGAMPFLHRWLGNPMFTFLARWWFGSRIHDVYCGMRGFTKELYQRLNLRCTGMEFATEMVIKAFLSGSRIAEVPITLHPDGRKAHAPHLKTFRDGWRTLRFYLMCSPRWLFLFPGLGLIALGLVGYALALPSLRIVGVTFDAHTLLFSNVAVVCGFQAIVFALLTETFASQEGLLPDPRRRGRLREWMTLERGLVLGAAMMVFGVVLLCWAVNFWRERGFGHLDYSFVMRRIIPGALFTTLGFQTLLASFFLSILEMRRR